MGRFTRKMAKLVLLPAGSVVVFNRGYVDYKWLYDLDSRNIYFATRTKYNINYDVTKAYETQSESGFITISTSKSSATWLIQRKNTLFSVKV